MRGYVILFLVLVVVFAVQSYNMKKSAAEKLKNELDEGWGKKRNRKYGHNEYERISHYYRQTREGKNVIDDITWNDLSMDDVFRAMNHTWSSVGEESLYRRLRIPQTELSELEKFGRMSSVFEKNPEKTKQLQQIYAEIGRTRSVSLYDFITTASKLTQKPNLPHYLDIVLMLASIVGLFLEPVYAVVGLLVV